MPGVFAIFAQETRQIRQRLSPVVVRAPQEIDVAFRHLAEEFNRVITRRFNFVEVAFRQIPNGFGVATMRLVGHHEVGPASGGKTCPPRAPFRMRSAGR